MLVVSKKTRSISWLKRSRPRSNKCVSIDSRQRQIEEFFRAAKGH